MTGTSARTVTLGLVVALLAAAPGWASASSPEAGPKLSTPELRASQSAEARAEANLVVADVSWAEDPREGEEVVFRAEIVNDGRAAARPSTTAYAVDGGQLDAVATPAVPPGQSTVVEARAWTAEPGAHGIGVRADARDAVAEGDETDNAARERLHVAAPNLAAGVEVISTAPTTEDPIEVRVTVANTGDRAADAFGVEIRLDGATVDRQRLDRLAPGEANDTLVTLGPIADPGTYEIAVEVDVDAEVAETAETDNVARATIEVTEPPDPAVTELTVEEPELVPGGPTHPTAERAITAAVTNEADAAPRTSTELTLTACPTDRALPAAALAGCETVDTRELAGGEVDGGATVETAWDPTGKLGDWTICATLEVTGTQTDPSNDERCRDTVVLVAGTGGVAAG